MSGLILAAAAPVAAASTETFTYSQPAQTNFLQPFGANLLALPLDAFNPSLGTLTGITFDYDYDATIRYVAAEPDPANGEGGAPYYGPVGQYDYGATTFSSGTLALPYSETVNTSDPSFDVTATISLHPVVTVTGAALAPYVSGAETYQVFDVDATPDFRGGGVATGSESASMSVTYDYIPAVPELAAWEIMIAGFVLIGLVMRRHLTTNAGDRSVLTDRVPGPFPIPPHFDSAPLAYAANIAAIGYTQFRL